MLLICHAESSGQAPDAELTRQGADQARALKDMLTALGVDAVYSSPYRRALSTISPFAEQSGFAVTTVHDLHERILSPTPQDDWLDHIARSFADHDYKLSGGESLRETRTRALRALTTISETDHRLAAVVSHGNLMASVFSGIDPAFGFEAWRALRNPDVFELDLESGTPVAFRRMG